MPEPQNILLALPTWVGDCVMATPAIRALRQAWPAARITGICLRNTKPVLAGIPWLDRLISYRRRSPLIRTAARIRRSGFDTAILLPNSFRIAMLVWLAGIPRRVGYDTDARRFLLTDRLRTPRGPGFPVDTPTLRSYLELVSFLSGDVAAAADHTMRLFVTDADRRDAAGVLQGAGVASDSPRPWVLLNPGAHNGPAKMWPGEHFATVADRLVTEMKATVLVSAAPRERPVVQHLCRLASEPLVDLSVRRMTLGALKAICGQVDLVITNDTGPRHLAAAMGTRLVTLFGPTDPRRTTIDYPREVMLFERVFCGPCQRKVCPLDHRCMTRLRPERVYEAAAALLQEGAPLPILAGM